MSVGGLAAEPISCPFCGYQAAQGEYDILLHMETNHAEGKSPFVADGDHAALAKEVSARSFGPGSGTGVDDVGEDDDDDDDGFAMCPLDGCGEMLSVQELDDHLEVHAQMSELDAVSRRNEDLARNPSSGSGDRRYQGQPDAGLHEPHQTARDRRVSQRTSPAAATATPTTNSTTRAASPHGPRQTGAIQSWRNILSMPVRKHTPPTADNDAAANGNEPKRKRLGKAELGKYAHEQQMPAWLITLLQEEKMVMSQGVIPVLEQFLRQSSLTNYAYLCHPCVQHISKLKREGGFCGYRNIQMMSSYVIGSGAKGSEHFSDEVPSIFQIQDLIEAAWDRGINAQARQETGGVKGTRKYIGTPEAQAVFCYLGVPCDAQGFKKQEKRESEKLMLQAVERYFESGDCDHQDKVRCTNLAPIYFQHRGHSMTIVGIEKMRSGETSLLVFDPMFQDAHSIAKLIGRTFEHRFPDMALKSYRRGNAYLKKYKEFEILRLAPSAEVLRAT